MAPTNRPSADCRILSGDMRWSCVDTNCHGKRVTAPVTLVLVPREETPEERCSSEDYALDAIFAHLRGEGPCTSVRTILIRSDLEDYSEAVSCGVQHRSPAIGCSENVAVLVEHERGERTVAVRPAEVMKICISVCPRIAIRR